jgi:hypothetical protein
MAGKERGGRNVGVVDDPTAFATFLASLSETVRVLVATADEVIRREDPRVVQVLWPHQRTIGYGIGPKKLSEHYAYLDIYDRHVNLGFNHGAALPDPEGLLEGTGMRFRKTTLRQPEDAHGPGLRAPLRAARAERVDAVAQAKGGG